LLGLVGMIGTCALSGVTALHVLLEHHGRYDAVAHANDPDVRTGTGHAHPHQARNATPSHSHPGPHDLRPAEAPGHDHVLVLTADLQPRSDRPGTDLLAHRLADATPSPIPGVVSSPLTQPSRAGPAARAAPLSRRSVVLQL
jgi:hypothetical protein